MADTGTKIIKMTSVPLTKDKQVLVTAELDKYAAATNLVIASILKYRITSKVRAFDVLRDFLERKYLLGIEKTDDERKLRNARILYANHCSEDVINAILGIQGRVGRRADETLLEYTTVYADQYARDVIQSAFSEMARHRKMAKIIRGLKDATPYFKKGRLVVSSPLRTITEKALLLYSTTGEEIIIPFDKYSRNREASKLGAVNSGEWRANRVRITQRDAGYLEIAIKAQR